jgi:hypothetical protein
MWPIEIARLRNARIISAMLGMWKAYESSGASSHWQILGPQSEIRIEKEAIVALHGAGFGDCQKMGIGVSRVFHVATILSYLAFLRDRSSILPWMARARKMLYSLRDIDMFFSYDVFRQCCIASILEPYIAQWRNPTILLIGDGYGILSGLLKIRFPESRLFPVDIFPALLFQAVVLGKSMPEIRQELTCSDGLRKNEAGDRNIPAEITFCHANDLSLLDGNGFHIAINVASMQEMTPDSVRNYFAFIRSHLSAEGLFYCCNREEKVLPGSEVLRFDDYPWNKADSHLLDEEPRFYRWFFSPRPTARSLKMAAIPVPFGRLFDGAMRHRLTRLFRTGLNS